MTNPTDSLIDLIKTHIRTSNIPTSWEQGVNAGLNEAITLIRQHTREPVSVEVAEARDILAKRDFVGVEESEKYIAGILSADQPVDCRAAFEAWHNEEHGFVPSYGETCYDSEDSDALYDAFKGAWQHKRESGGHYRMALEHIREIWAGSECGTPVYAQEAYAINLCKEMYQEAVDALRTDIEGQKP